MSTASSTEADIRAAFGRSRERDARALIEDGATLLDPAVAFQLGDQARRKRWHRSAVSLLDHAQAGLSDPTPARTALVECHIALRDWNAALAAAQAVLARDPRHRRALRQKARVLARLGRPDEALAVLEHYAGVASNWAEPWAETTRIHAARGDWAKAVASARETLARDGANEEVLGTLIDGLVALGREAEAEEHFLGMARRDPNRVARSVRMYLRMGRPLAAAHACRGLAGARGSGADVTATTLMLRSALAEAQGFSRKEADAASSALDLPVGGPAAPGQKRGIAGRIIANLTG